MAISWTRNRPIRVASIANLVSYANGLSIFSTQRHLITFKCTTVDNHDFAISNVKKADARLTRFRLFNKHDEFTPICIFYLSRLTERNN